MGTNSKHENVWDLIDAEKRRDRLIRRVSVAAWSVTMAVLLVFAGIIGRQVADTMRRVDVGVAPSGAVWDVLLPFVAVVGAVSLVIAVLATVGVFLRLRTASLNEIQVRLAALEQLITERAEPSR
jgi:hypothetical protein